MVYNNIKRFFDNLYYEDIVKHNEIDHKKYVKQFSEFKEYYKKGECYICKNSFKSFSSNNVCLHSLLRQNKFKKKFLKDIYSKWTYFNIATYLRRCANQEGFIKNINNLEEEKGSNKKFEYTIKRKNIERTLSCSNQDFNGHEGRFSNFPHYHFQMRIDKKPFIDFTDFHIPFSGYDLRVFEAIEKKCLKQNWGSGGVGIQEAIEELEVSKEKFIDTMCSTTDENEAQFHIHTIINGDISSDEYQKIIDEAKKTRKTINSIARKQLGDKKVQTIISPAESIHDIAKRKP